MVLILVVVVLVLLSMTHISLTGKRKVGGILTFAVLPLVFCSSST